MGNVPDLAILIPYETFQDLVVAAHSLKDLQSELARRDAQVSAVREELRHLHVRISELKDELRSYQD